MKKTLLYSLCSLALAAFALPAWGQTDGYRIPNGDFSKWKTTCGSTYQTSFGAKNGDAFGNVERPGVEPEAWNGSNINQTVYVNVFGAQNKKEDGLVTSDKSDKHVVLTNKFVGVLKIGSNAPAYITFGTPWVYAISDVKSCDGGTYGGTTFKGKPDAIKGTFKRTSSESENAYIIAYLWNGTFKSNVKCTKSGSESTMPLENVDKAILGKVSATSNGTLVASCEKSFATTKDNDWETIEVPLEYKDETAVPEKMNVIISSADYWTRGNIKAENILEVKNVEFVYYHYLSSCKYDGQNIVFDKDSSAVVMAKYDESKLTYVKKGVGATVEKSYDDATGKLIVTVKGNDYEVDKTSVTTYTIRFVDSEEVLSSKDYTEDLYVSVNGMTTDPQATKVTVQTRNDGKINFVLKNFQLVSGDEAMSIGNIEVSGLENKDNVFTYNGNIEITEGDLEGVDVDDWYGPMLGEVPLNLTGEFVGDDHLKVAIDIDMSESLKQVINVHLGYTPAVATMAVKEGRQYGTFYAPFAVTLPDGVKAYKCNAMEANGYTLELTPVEGTSDGTTIAAKTAVIVETSNAFSQNFYNFDENLKLENGNTGYLYGVAEGGKTSAPMGSYVLQTQNGNQKFYKVTDETGDLKIEANRCYLQIPADKAGVKAISFPGDATAIDAVNALVNGKAEIYDLQGRRLQTLQKGVNIVNGRKVMVK